MKQAIIFAAALVFLAGCSSLSRAYLYSPSPLERASARTGADGSVTLADIDVMQFADAVEQAWRKRDQAARGIDMAEESAQAGLGAIPIITSLLNFAWPVGPIVAVVGSLISKVVGSINPSARIEAYADGIGMIAEAKGDYFQFAPGGKIPSDKLTLAGIALLKKANYAIAVVEKAIANRVPTLPELSGALGEKK